MKFSTIPFYCTKLYVTLSFAIASSVTYCVILQNCCNSVHLPSHSHHTQQPTYSLYFLYSLSDLVVFSFCVSLFLRFTAYRGLGFYYIIYTVLQCDLPPLSPHCGKPQAEIRTRVGRSRGRDSDHYSRPPKLLKLVS